MHGLHITRPKPDPLGQWNYNNLSNFYNSKPMKQKTGAARTPLTKTVNTFDTPEDRKEAAKALREAAGGSPSRLANHIDRINAHLKTIDGSQLEIGKELIEIMEEKDFAEDTVEQFVFNTWGWRRQRAYELAEAYRIKAGLPANVINLLQNPGQAKALKAAPESERAEVLKEVAAGGKVTAKAISEKIESRKAPINAEFEEEIRDERGTLVPPELHTEWRDALDTVADMQIHIHAVLDCWPEKRHGKISKEAKQVLNLLLKALPLEIREGKIVSRHPLGT